MSFPLIILLLKVRAPVYYIKYPRGSICYNQVKTLRRSCFDMKKKILKKNDRILIIIMLALLAGILIYCAAAGKDSGYQVVIYVGNEVYGTYSISDDQDIRIEQNGFTNVVRIKDKAVWMEESDCPNQLCIYQGKVTQPGIPIVCLPHGITVDVVGKNK